MTGRWGSGRHWKKSIPRHANNAAGCTRPYERVELPTQVGRKRNRHCTRSGRPRHRQTPRRHSSCSLKPMSRSIRKPLSACRKTEKNCWPFTTFRPSTGRASERRIPSSRPLPPFATEPSDSRGCLTRDGMLHMMFKLGQCAEKNWRRLRGFDDLAKVITGVKFNDGIEVKNVDQAAA